MFQVKMSHRTIELQPKSLPDAKYFLPLFNIIASLQTPALCPRKFAINCPEEIS